tara:strand:- start:244 stop:423 length:180 start_codon:yes stop_codon:yes gene_type:complete
MSEQSEAKSALSDIYGVILQIRDYVNNNVDIPVGQACGWPEDLENACDKLAALIAELSK